LSFIFFQIAGKRDKEQEAEAQEWIETITGERFARETFEDSLRDGILLCKLMNKLNPGTIQKIAVSGGDYKMMDNISQFQRAATFYGVSDVDLFNANDLWDQKNIALVTQTIFAVARAVRNLFKNLTQRTHFRFFFLSF
jgi:transgelin